MRIRLVTATICLAAAGTLAVAGTPSLSQAAGGSADRAEERGHAPTARDVGARDTISPCVGGAQKKAYSGGHADWFGTTSSDLVPGADFKFKGPSSGKDTVFVNLTAFETYANTGSYGRARVLLDGVDMAPASAATEWFYDSNNYEASVGQYCAKVGSGSHRVKVILESYGGGSSYLYNPMLHVEVAN